MAKNNNQNGYDFNIPGQGNAGGRANAPVDDSEGSYKRLLGDKPITLFWLLQHYSKENAAAYKAQKEARKQEKGRTPTPQPDPQPTPQPQPPQDDPPDSGDSFGGTLFVNHDTVFVPRATLDCLSYGRQIEINKPVFRIGRDSPQADLKLVDAPTVSSLHAEITYENGAFYIRDNNSTNGVYLNDRPIQRNGKALLSDNTTILLGVERFVFHCAQQWILRHGEHRQEGVF